MNSYKQTMNTITTFIFDVDGVLTDGTIHITTTGEMLRTMNTRDGFALKTALDSGYRIAIISGGSNPGVAERLKGLGIFDIYLGVSNKLETYEQFIFENNINPQHILYMGDDLPDYWVMEQVGLPTCPSDAAPEIKSISQYISHFNGGQGCVRDVIEQVLKVQGKWFKHFSATN